MAFRPFACALIVAFGVAGAAQAEPQTVYEKVRCDLGLKKRGCATTYSEGASVLRIDAATLRVAFRGNYHTPWDRAYPYALRKAAEETLEAGFDLFTVVEQSDLTERAVFGTVSPPSLTRASTASPGERAVERLAETSSSPRTTIVRPGVVLTVVHSRGPKPAGAPPNVFDAREVLANLQAQGR